MSRLTEKDEQGNWALKGVPWKSLHEGQIITKDVQERIYGALCKLMEYEDTGLSPKDVEMTQYILGDAAEKIIGKLEEIKNPMYREDGSLMTQKLFVKIDKAIEIVKQFTS